MVTTIGNGSITFTDGSSFSGTTPGGVITTDTSLGTATQAFNIGHLVFVQSIFPANGPGYYQYPGYFQLNNTNGYYSTPGGAGYGTITIYLNAVNANGTTNFGSQHYYNGITEYSPSYPLAGSWRSRGNPRGRGINQGFLNGYVAERVA
jgi:hypothetical protein